MPDKQSVENCLRGKNYYIDFYQREYVWSKETTETLLKDIFYMFELSYNQYKDSEINETLMNKYNWYYLNVYITNKLESKTYIVDGQQRLSTLTLIATKLYHLSDQENLKKLLGECIFSNNGFKDSYNLDNDKRHKIMEYIFHDREFKDNYANETEKTLNERYQDISKYLDNKFKETDSKKLHLFILYFLKRLVLVELVIEQNDTPMIFEVINDRGEALMPFEILKGKLIGALNKDDVECFCKIWEDSFKLLPDIEDSFFSDLIKSKFIFTRNSDIEKNINQSYHRYIFEDNSIAKALGFNKNNDRHISNIKNFIQQDIAYYAKLYNKIYTSNNEFLKYLKINELSGQYQIILSACTLNDRDEDKKIEIIAQEYERLWILLHLNGIHDSNEFQELSYRLNEYLKKVPIEEYQNIFDDLLKNTIKGRKGLENTTSLLDYESFKTRDYTNMNTRLLRYLFARVEKYICINIGIEPQNDVLYITTKTGDKTGYHIEHILSRNETNIAYFESKEEFETQRNILGGLLLLKDKVNLASQNEEYKEKLKTYSNSLVWGHTLCNDFYHKTNKDFLEFNNRLEKNGVRFMSYKNFDKKALYERSKLLYEIVKIVWKVER